MKLTSLNTQDFKATISEKMSLTTPRGIERCSKLTGDLMDSDIEDNMN